MAEPAYRPVALVGRSPEIVSRVWEALCDHQEAAPDDRRLLGARIAGQWTLGLSPMAPISRRELPADDTTTSTEAHTAAMVVDGITPGNVDYARGVEAWLFWLRGVEDLPSWLLPPAPRPR